MCSLISCIFLFQLYPDHDIRNVVEAAYKVDITDWPRFPGIPESESNIVHNVRPFKCIGKSQNTVFFGYKTDFFSIQNNLKHLDPSYKMDLDIWDHLGRVKLVFQQNFMRLVYLFTVIILYIGTLYVLGHLLFWKK